MLELFLYEISFDGVLSWQDGSLRAVCVVEHAENDLGQGVGRRGVVRGRDHGRKVVLESLTEHRVECQVGPNDVLLNPHLAPQTLDLLPKAIKVLKKFFTIITIIRHRRKTPVDIKIIQVIRGRGAILPTLKICLLTHFFLWMRCVCPENPQS